MATKPRIEVRYREVTETTVLVELGNADAERLAKLYGPGPYDQDQLVTYFVEHEDDHPYFDDHCKVLQLDVLERAIVSATPTTV